MTVTRASHTEKRIGPELQSLSDEFSNSPLYIETAVRLRIIGERIIQAP